MLKNIRSFKLRVSSSDLVDLNRRLIASRFPDQLDHPANSDWEYGTELNYLQTLTKYWSSEFNWRKQEDIFNAMPQFTATLPTSGRKIHFVHKRCTLNEKAPAILLSHGWPGSVFEFYKILDPLSEHFHVVAPSIPGYGFSEPSHKRGFSCVEASRDFHELMQGLGYTHYVAQGGDWGSIITRSLGILFPDYCKAIHVNMPIARQPENFNPLTLSKKELSTLARAKAFQTTGTGYQAIQRTKPQTLSYALNDSPVGLLAWIVEKFREWSDCDGDVEKAFSRDEILTNVSIYWFSRSIGSSMRLYYESMATMPGTNKELKQLGRKKCLVPSAISVFPKEIFSPPKSWCEESYNLKRYTVFKKGGHFAALEQPQALLEDIKSFFLDDLDGIAGGSQSMVKSKL